MEKRSDEIIAFQKRAMKMLLEFAKQEGIQSKSDLNSKKGTIMFQQPLWQILEANSKYGGPLISEGVKDVEDRVGRLVSASSGTWSERHLVKTLGEREDGGRWSQQSDYRCQLEHVVERTHLLQWLLERPDCAIELLDSYLIGCVILKKEHARLPGSNADIASSDPWKRYRLATPQVRVWSRIEQKWISLEPPPSPPCWLPRSSDALP